MANPLGETKCQNGVFGCRKHCLTVRVGGLRKTPSPPSARALQRAEDERSPANGPRPVLRAGPHCERAMRVTRVCVGSDRESSCLVPHRCVNALQCCH